MGKWVVGIPHVEAICAAHTHTVYSTSFDTVPEISKQAKIFAKVKVEEKMAAKEEILFLCLIFFT